MLACVVFVGACLLPNVGLLDEERVGDTPQYRARGEAVLDGQIPYRDFYLEYPPGALPMFVPPAAGDSEGYATRFEAPRGRARRRTRGARLGRGRGSRADVVPAVLRRPRPVALGPVVIVNFDLGPRR